MCSSKRSIFLVMYLVCPVYVAFNEAFKSPLVLTHNEVPVLAIKLPCTLHNNSLLLLFQLKPKLSRILDRVPPAMRAEWFPSLIMNIGGCYLFLACITSRHVITSASASSNSRIAPRSFQTSTRCHRVHCDDTGYTISVYTSWKVT